MFWALLLAVQAGSAEIVTQHVNGVAYTRTDIESACGVHVIQIRYRNDWPQGIRGRVNFVRIDNVDIVGAASGLEERAANRTISGIEIMNCGFDERDPVISAVMRLARLESQYEGLSPNVYFRLTRAAGSWQISWE